MFISGRLRTLSEIFTFKLVPVTVVATDLGKEKNRFKQLIKDPDEFIYQEIRLFGAWCRPAPFEMGVLIETEHPGNPPDETSVKEEKFAAIKPLIEEGTIVLLDDIFKYIHKYTIAGMIGRKGATLDRYLKNVDHFSIGDIRAIGEHFGLKLSATLRLVDAQYEKQTTGMLKKPE
jgi:hypothetical protein